MKYASPEHQRIRAKQGTAVDLKLLIVYWMPGLLLLYVITFYGTSIEGDFGAYKDSYNKNTTNEPIFKLLNRLFSQFMPFEAFFFLVGTWQMNVLSKLAKKTKTSRYLLLLSLIFLAGMGWAGHWRQSIAVCIFAYFGFTYKAALISIFTHFGFVLAALFYFFQRNLILISGIFLLLIYFVQQSEILHQFFYLIGRERFLFSFLGLYQSDFIYFEHRNLWQMNNYKLWMSLSIILIVITSRKLKCTGSSSILILLPYTIYVVMGFDAYLAQKASLSLVFLAPFGVAALQNKYSRFLCSLLLIADLGSSSYLRFSTLL